jgi:hypothetical protein
MRTFLLLLTAALLGMSVSGCTVIGLGIGLAVDHRNGREHRVSCDSLKSVPRGRVVEVTLTYGDTLRGTFTGTGARPEDSYRPAYDTARALLGGDTALPAIGETLTVTTPRGWNLSGLFCALDAGALAIHRLEDDSTVCLPAFSVSQIRNRDGHGYDPALIRDLVSSGSLPSALELVVESGGKTRGIPLEHIRQIYAPPRRTHYWILGGVVGLVVDVTLAAVAWRYSDYHQGWEVVWD